MTLTLDRRRKGEPVRARRMELQYGGRLKKIAEQVGVIINGFPPGDPSAAPKITEVLSRYSDALHQWAINTASSMLMDVALRDERNWMTLAKDMSRSLREEIRNAPTGQVMQQLLAEQVGLIKSIPREAAQRVHRLTLEGIENSARASEIAKEIMRSGDVAKSRAMLIARTEVSRTATTLTQARAQHIGSPGYWWETTGDGDVRPSHKKMQGTFVKWDEPPTLDGMTGHAGCMPNCRCWARVALPE